ncbi:MAG: hypothetical protein KC419_13610 [Anaerolineales bacterium]|nr:hypothetical protein [Anaerolineales bacterium]
MTQQEEATPEYEAPSLSEMVIYVVLTAVLLLLLITFTRLLGNQPRYQPVGNERLSPRWQIVTNRAKTFTFNLPLNWSWYDKQIPEQSSVFQSVLAEQGDIETAVSFFRQIDPATEIQLVAQPESAAASTFLIVANSRRMQQLDPETLTRAVANDVAGVLQAETSTQAGGQTIANLIVDFPTESGPLRCKYRYAHNDVSAYILAGCAPKNQFGQLGGDLLEIQNSFQLLIN